MTVDLNLGYDEHDSFHHYKLYVTTFLGYGGEESLPFTVFVHESVFVLANMAITRYEKQLVEQLLKKPNDGEESSSPISISA